MPVPEPTSWPTTFTWTTVHPIADYLNEPIDAARAAYNAHWGTNISSELEWQQRYLPKYPSDGWLRYGGGIPDFQIIGPSGVRGFGLHEFQGHPEIVERVNRMNLLATTSTGGTTMPQNPIDPNTGLPAGTPPTPPATTTPLPPGTPPTPPSGGTPLPPGTPDPNSPPIGQTPGTPGATPSNFIVLHGHYEVGVQFNTGSQAGDATPVRITSDAAWFWFFTDNNPEIIIKVVGDVNHPWVFAAGLTDVGCTITVRDKDNPANVKTYTNRQGAAFQPIQDTSAF
jgi:hypothetical protein